MTRRLSPTSWGRFPTRELYGRGRSKAHCHPHPGEGFLPSESSTREEDQRHTVTHILGKVSHQRALRERNIKGTLSPTSWGRFPPFRELYGRGRSKEHCHPHPGEGFLPPESSTGEEDQRHTVTHILGKVSHQRALRERKIKGTLSPTSWGRFPPIRELYGRGRSKEHCHPHPGEGFLPPESSTREEDQRHTVTHILGKVSHQRALRERNVKGTLSPTSWGRFPPFRELYGRGRSKAHCHPHPGEGFPPESSTGEEDQRNTVTHILGKVSSHQRAQRKGKIKGTFPTPNTHYRT